MCWRIDVYGFHINAQVADAVSGMDDGLTKVDSDINQLSVLPAYIDSMN